MDFVNVTEDGTNDFEVGGNFYLDLQVHEEPAGNAVADASPAESATEIGRTAEHKEIEDFTLDDYKIVAEIRPQDAFVLQKLRDAVIVPTWHREGEPSRQVGKVLRIGGDTASEYTENLERAGEQCFPEDSTNRALEVIY